MADAAVQLSVSRSYLYQLIDRGVIRRVKIGRRSVIPATEIERILEEGAE
jgi:excisionase family DNA binding protein